MTIPDAFAEILSMMELQGVVCEYCNEPFRTTDPGIKEWRDMNREMCDKDGHYDGCWHYKPTLRHIAHSPFCPVVRDRLRAEGVTDFSMENGRVTSRTYGSTGATHA